MKTKQSFSFLFLCLLLTASCSRQGEHQSNFYYWKTTVSVDSMERNCFKSLKCKVLYLRFFDVDKTDTQALPQGEIQPFESLPLDAEYVPVVFITNRVFLNLKENEIDDLAKHVNGLIGQINQKNKIPSSPEIQIDCDWTERTRAAYFEFLSSLKKVSGKKITCTIRLHQIKYKNKTGIPPVEKGYLMCYATSNPDAVSEKNSILDMTLLKDYTQNINDYPITFDVALPLFSWGIVSNHLSKIKLINGLSESELTAPMFKKVAENQYEVQSDFFFKGIYLNKGFKVKIEKITPELLQQAKQYLNEKIKRDYNIVYYHLDELFLKQFSINDLK